MRARRRKAYRFGHFAETLCVWSLRLRGYRLIARRFDAGVGEIDIVAQRGRVLAMVEVKARRSDDAEVLGARQRARIARAAEAFVAQRRRFAHLDIRFDLMTLRPWRLPRHLRDAWRP